VEGAAFYTQNKMIFPNNISRHALELYGSHVCWPDISLHMVYIYWTCCCLMVRTCTSYIL